MINKWFIATLVFTTSFVFSDCEKEKVVPRSEYCNETLSCGYNASSKTFKKNYDIYVEAEALIWQPKEQALDIALINTTNKANPSKILNTHFDYSPGFKISLGSDFTLQAWDLWADYTKLKTENHAEKNVDLARASLLNYWSFFSPSGLNKIKSKWFLDLQTFDLSFGRSYFVGKKIIFHPFFGLRSGWIDQRMKVSSSNLANDYLFKAFSKSWLTGPRIGIKTNWLVGRGFSLFCNADASIFYQHFILRMKEQNLTGLILFQAKNVEKTINSNVDLSTGFDWGHSFCNNKWSLVFSAGYEMQVFWNQNKIRTFVEELKNETNLQSGNLMPHGFIVSLKSSF